MKHFFHFTALLLIFFSMNVHKVSAQSDSVTVRIFDGSSTTSSESSYNPSYEDKNYIYFNYTLLVRGAFVMGYERVLHDKHSISIDLGLTYRDFIYEGLTFDDISSTQEEVTPGHYFSINYKFYPMDYEEFDGSFYISPGFISRKYNLAYELESNGDISEFDGSYSMRDISLKFGLTNESMILDGDLITDIYIGVGFRKSEYSSYEYVYNNSGTIIEPIHDVKKVPAIYFGAKIGFIF